MRECIITSWESILYFMEVNKSFNYNLFPFPLLELGILSFCLMLFPLLESHLLLFCLLNSNFRVPSLKFQIPSPLGAHSLVPLMGILNADYGFPIDFSLFPALKMRVQTGSSLVLCTWHLA